MANLTTKRCPKCKRTLPLTYAYFTDSNSTWDGWSSYCKECNAAASKKWRDENPEQFREIAKRSNSKWRKENPQRQRQYGQSYRARKRAAGGKFTAEDVRELFDHQF